MKRKPHQPMSFRLSPEAATTLSDVSAKRGWTQTHALEVAIRILAGKIEQQDAPPPPLIVVESRHGYAVYRGDMMLAELATKKQAESFREKLRR